MRCSNGRKCDLFRLCTRLQTLQVLSWRRERRLPCLRSLIFLVPSFLPDDAPARTRVNVMDGWQRRAQTRRRPGLFAFPGLPPQGDCFLRCSAGRGVPYGDGDAGDLRPGLAGL